MGDCCSAEAALSKAVLEGTLSAQKSSSSLESIGPTLGTCLDIAASSSPAYLHTCLVRKSINVTRRAYHIALLPSQTTPGL